MNINPVVKKKTLTSINTQSGKEQLPQYRVYLYVYDRGSVYYIATNFLTTNPEMRDGIFTDRNETRETNIQRTIQLGNIVSDAIDYANSNPKLSVKEIKKRVRLIVSGRAYADDKKMLWEYVAECANAKSKKGKRKCQGTKDIYNATSLKVKAFDYEATFESIDHIWLEDFESYMISEGLASATRAMHLRNLKTTINWAIDILEVYDGRNPFRKFVISEEKVDHLVLTAQQLADFRDYPCEGWQEIYRDIAMLTFYMCGMNIGDLSLTKSLSPDGRWLYERRKTGHDFDLPVCEEAMAIINKYKGKTHLLCILDNIADYKTFAQHCNKALKKIGIVMRKGKNINYIPMFPDMTLYTFRRTFATIASQLDIQTEVIAMCLGHEWATGKSSVTERYIRRDTRKVDEAIAMVVNHLRNINGRDKEIIDAELLARK